MHGALAALILASLVLATGWLLPVPEAELRPWAARLALPLLLIALLVALWPIGKPGRAAELDQRLGAGDRLATAWAFRRSSSSIVLLQRSDAIAQLHARSPRAVVHWRPSRLELGLLAGLGLVTLVLLIAPSPQQPALDRQAAEQLAVQRATERLDLLRQAAASAPRLSPQQAQHLDELLRQARSQMSGVGTQREAAAILAKAEDQISQQVSDPNADARDQALAAMSETLATEPLSRSLGAALANQDAAGTGDALKAMTAQADQLSDVQRQALSRALQRAANVGRSDQQSAGALHEAATAIGSGESADAALSAADAALGQAIQSATAQVDLRQTSQRLRDLESQLAAGAPMQPDPGQSTNPAAGADAPPGALAGDQPGAPPGTALGSGAPQAAGDAGVGQFNALANEPGQGAGVGAAGSAPAGQAAPGVQPAEDVFVAGNPGNGPADQNPVDQPFSVRGEPRPYREVLGQYAQSSRDYVDRPDVSPAVRDLVKQYFQQLEDGQ